MIIWIGDGVCTSINFNFHGWYEVEIRLSDNPRQKETIDGIIWLRRKKCNLQIRYYFQYSSCGPVTGAKNELFLQEGYLQISIEWYLKRDGKLHTTSGSWKMTMADWFYKTLGWDFWRNCSLCLQKRIKFHTWGTKMFLRKFYQT